MEYGYDWSTAMVGVRLRLEYGYDCVVYQLIGKIRNVNFTER